MNHVFYFFKQLQSYAGKKLYGNLVGMIIISLLDGIGILMLIPLISVSGILNINTEALPITFIFDFFNQFTTSVSLLIILGIFLTVNILQNLVQRFLTIENAKIQHGFFRELRLDTYQSLLQSNWNFYLKKRKTDLINSLTAELAQASAGTNTFLQLVTGVIFTLIQVGIAFFLSPQITIFVLVSGLILSFFSRQFIKKSQALGSRNWEFGKEFLAGITDTFNGIKEVKSNSLEDSRMKWYGKLTQRMHDEQVEFTKLKSASQFYYKIAQAVLIALFVFFSIHLFHAQAAQLTFIMIIFSRLWPRITGIQSSLEQIATFATPLRSVINLQHECKISREITDDMTSNVNPIYIERCIELVNVNFRYNENQSNYALKNINVLIPSNQMTAIVGPSGAGKSTFIDLLMGLNQPETGEVFLDGAPLSKGNLLSLRKSISYVPQDPFLFNTSIRENLLLISPDSEEKDLWEALEFSSAAEFVRKLPQGLDTIIGDRGIRLSGGERQRLVLARAILRKPSILVLDEATSALDSENEAKIQEALGRLRGKLTLVVIAHRLSTIKNADQVVVLSEGEIVQKGGFNQLAIEKKSVFGNLLSKQMASNVLDTSG
ncbi:ABC transporter ATP-binding protein [Litchfieldia salsa]|uniref:ATP-binding cassette, subfamily C n=1 Tax=Litchfieldia salsa TaxID=930152 RepID=A0A1H0VEX0_9BACI|nr:ABC transporter ATP-binding protein [Litchfieldia salsa]SDP77027.1 ATP-binding cassette, subfamily C [Litchfieldia salsa]